MALHAAVGKTPAHVKKDVPGFIGNRLQHALWREAIALVEHGICDAETVDTVIKAAFGRRLAVLGPLENADLVGTDLTLAIHKTVLPAIESRPGPSPYLEKLVADGKLGFKIRRGVPHLDAGAAAGAAGKGPAASQEGARERRRNERPSREAIMTSNSRLDRHAAPSSRPGLGAVAAPAVLRVIPANAQSRVDQDRPCQPAHRPARRLRRGRHLHPRAGARHPRQGPRGRRQDLSGADHQQGQPVERHPRLRSRVRADPRRQGRPDRRLGDARHHQPGRRPGRGQRGAVHHHQLPVAAVLLRPPRRSEEGVHLDLPLLLGPGGRDRARSWRCGTARRPTRWWAACSPTTPTATPGATPSSACRRRSPRPATSCTIPAATR